MLCSIPNITRIFVVLSFAVADWWTSGVGGLFGGDGVSSSSLGVFLFRNDSIAGKGGMSDHLSR